MKGEIARIRPSLPPGLRFHLEWDESMELGEELRELFIRGSLAFLAVRLVLALTLRSLRAVGLVIGSAAVAIAGTALSLYLLGIPANLLTLAGLAGWGSGCWCRTG